MRSTQSSTAKLDLIACIHVMRSAQEVLTLRVRASIVDERDGHLEGLVRSGQRYRPGDTLEPFCSHVSGAVRLSHVAKSRKGALGMASCHFLKQSTPRYRI